MFIALVIGAIFGILGVKLPDFVLTVADACKSCMSPLGMILTGITFASISFRKIFLDWSIYFVSFLRLVALPFLFAGLYLFATKVIGFVLPDYFYTLLVCAWAMPLGLNTVVIPAAYGKDTSTAAGMALISHTLSVITIPLVFTLLNLA